MTKRFCDKCGNATLLRASAGLDAATGQLTVYLKKNFSYNLRGTVYSIPLPKGGSASHKKNKGDIILREDQKEFARGMKAYERTMRKSQIDPDMWPSLMASASIRESWQNGLVLHPPTVGYGRKNINQVGPKRA